MNLTYQRLFIAHYSLLDNEYIFYKNVLLMQKHK